MRKLKYKRNIFLILFIINCIVLVGCGNNKQSEQAICDDLPEELINSFSVCYVFDGSEDSFEGEMPVFEVSSAEITKRKTEDNEDEVYCSLIMENDYYKYMVDCVLYYSYYDEDGWILDGWEIQKSSAEALAFPSEDLINIFKAHDVNSGTGWESELKISNTTFDKEAQKATFEMSVKHYYNTDFVDPTMVVATFDSNDFTWFIYPE